MNAYLGEEWNGACVAVKYNGRICTEMFEPGLDLLRFIESVQRRRSVQGEAAAA